MDPEIDALLRAGDIEGAAQRARALGHTRRAAELLALLGRHAEAAILALEANEWRAALDAALASDDERVVSALCTELGKRGPIAEAAAAHARITQRDDVSARILEPLFPAEAGATWYARGEYAFAAQCFDRAGDIKRTITAYEQHLSQYPDDVDAAERLAVLRATRGDDEGAVRALQLAAKSNPRASVLAKLIEALRRVGLDGAARVTLRRLRVSTPNAGADIEAFQDALPRGEGEERYAGRYRVLRQVGSGAAGRVMEARDELTGETVALKVLTVSDDKGAAFARFMREAELARSLDDPTLVRLRALDPEGPTIVYDWMPGGTLTDRIGHLSMAEIHAIANRLLRALSVLHRHGVVHRDLKPSNVLFDPAGQARLSDLGAAHLGDLGATVTGGLVGSLPYMSPEQITGSAVTAATDLYALGCMLFQLILGRTPFLGPDFVMQHLNDVPPTPSSLRPGLGTEFDAIFTALLAKEAEHRPRDAQACEQLFLTCSWQEPNDGGLAPLPRPSLIPAARNSIAPHAAAHTATQWRVASQTPGMMFDSRLERDIEAVTVDPVHRDLLFRWAALDASDLQCIVDIDESEEQLVAWVLPATDGGMCTADELDGSNRDRVLAALTAAGMDGLSARGALCARSQRYGSLALVRSLVPAQSHAKHS
ncbi:MAG: protein kinase [Deltaproteobacteria bacterium]|nr:protein kinase [Deltaproteobacteria bacterium]